MALAGMPLLPWDSGKVTGSKRWSSTPVLHRALRPTPIPICSQGAGLQLSTSCGAVISPNVYCLNRFYYLSLIMDVYSRRIMGYHLADNLRADNNFSALK